MPIAPNCSVQPIRIVRVLVADRNLFSAQLLAQALQRDRQFQPRVVPNVAQMMSAGSEVSVAVISFDLAGGIEETLRTARIFNQRYPKVRLIILMDTPSRDRVVDAFRCGASGVFSRNQPIADFLKCVDRVSQGEIWASRSEIDYLLSALRSTPGSRIIGSKGVAVLTKRELEVVRHAGEGLNNREIADKLDLSEHTVKNYLFRACEKIGVSNRVELLFYLLKQERCSSAEGDSDSKLLQAAEEGFPAAQLALGLAQQRGDGVDKDDLSAYYWLRIAEQNAEQILEKSRGALQQLRGSLNPDSIQEIERSLFSDDNPQRDASRPHAAGKRKHLLANNRFLV